MPATKTKAEHRRLTARAVVLEAVSKGMTYRDACKLVPGLSESAVYAWSTDPAFRSELAAIQKQRREDAEHILASEIRASLDTIRMIRDDETQEGGTRLRAAVEMLDRVGVVKTDRAEVHLHTHAEDVSDEELDAELVRIQAMREKLKGEPDGDDDKH